MDSTATPDLPATTIEDLAREVLAMLLLQRRYFKTRNKDDLATSIRAESALKIKCEDVLRQRTL
jgi:hypothetical protein